MIHDDDKKALTDIANVLVEKIGERPAVRESVTRLLDLVYEKGQLRGMRSLIDEQVAILRGDATADTERPAVST
jgi:hypothetical protein